MQFSEEINQRRSLFQDPYVRGFDSTFWKGDTANLVFDTAKNRVKIGDTGLVGSASSFSQYLYGDFEFAMTIDSLSPDSNDSVKYFGLRNVGDTLQRGAAYFDLSYDTTAGDSSPNARPFATVIFDEAGNRQRKTITWDTSWGGGGRVARFRISWEADGYTFLVNDSVISTMGDRVGVGGTTNQINTSIPQALRMSNRSLDTTDTSATSLVSLNIRNARGFNDRVML
jgi:hypothetical protein